MGYPIFHSQYTAAQIEASIGKTPRIKSSTRTWEIWDIATSAYVDTGVSIDTQLYVDPTLTESGYAADAKVTGDEIGELKSALNDTAFISGNGNTYIEQDFALVKAGKSYKVQVCSWDTSGVTVTGGYTKFYLGYKNNGTKVKIAEILMSGTIENEYNVQIPANAVNPALVIGGRVTASKQGVVRVEDISLNAEINKNSNRIGKIDLISQFEVGDINITNAGWSYGVSNSRVRTKYGVTFHLYPGDTVGLTDYTNYRYYTGLRKTNGTYDLYAWRQSDLPITIEGDYVFTIDHVTSTEVTDKTELASLFFGFDGVAYESIRATDYLADRLVALYMPLRNGYLNTNGNISTDGSTQEVTTDYIPATKGDEFICSYSFDTSKSMWLAYCSYDANKRLIGSRNVPINSLSSASGTAVISVSANNARYIRISYRTYGSISMQIKTSNISKVLSNRISDTNNVISEQNYAVNEHVKSINHRGYALSPENTLTAFRASKKEGFGIVETDVRFTSDGVPVLLHDESINRTARNADGSAISGTINIADITYAQAAEYDFGVYKGAEYAGVKIPKYEDFLKLCRAIGLDCYIELKAGTEAQIRSLVDMGAHFGMREHITWIGPESYLAVVSAYDQSARIGFIAGSLSQQSAENMLSYKTSSNDVFANLNYYDSSLSTSLSIAKSVGLPVEVWSVNNTATIISMDAYITGVTSDYYVAGYVLYDDAIRNDYIGV